jgi:hypothetical protein
MNTFNDSTLTDLSNTTGDHLLILDGQQRKEYFDNLPENYARESTTAPIKKFLKNLFK